MFRWKKNKDPLPAGPRKLKGHIFIVTYGRSGSTLLQSLIQTIPGVYISGENFNALVPLFESVERVRRARKTWGRKNHPSDHPWFGANRYEPDRYAGRLAQVFSQEIIQPPSDARWIGFKEIRYPGLGDDLPNFLDFMAQNFKNSFFVFNSRSVEDVARSKWWAKKDPEDVYQLLRGMDGFFADYAARHPETSHHVFHENTVADPGTLIPVFEKLGEVFDREKIDNVLGKKLLH